MSTCLAAKVALVILEGGTFDRDFQWKSGSPAVAVDLTGYNAAMDIRTELASDTPLISLALEAGPWAADANSGIYITDAAEGMFKIYIKEEDTMGLCATHEDVTAVYDIFLTSSDGEAVFKMFGACKILAAVTRP